MNKELIGPLLSLLGFICGVMLVVSGTIQDEPANGTIIYGLVLIVINFIVIYSNLINRIQSEP